MTEIVDRDGRETGYPKGEWLARAITEVLNEGRGPA